ncbi:hypothetical protein AKJ16_DCAP07272 [Drosera capensis]
MVVQHKMLPCMQFSDDPSIVHTSYLIRSCDFGSDSCASIVTTVCFPMEHLAAVGTLLFGILSYGASFPAKKIWGKLHHIVTLDDALPKVGYIQERNARKNKE